MIIRTNNKKELYEALVILEKRGLNWEDGQLPTHFFNIPAEQFERGRRVFLHIHWNTITYGTCEADDTGITLKEYLKQNNLTIDNDIIILNEEVEQ